MFSKAGHTLNDKIEDGLTRLKLQLRPYVILELQAAKRNAETSPAPTQVSDEEYLHMFDKTVKRVKDEVLKERSRDLEKLLKSSSLDEDATSAATSMRAPDFEDGRSCQNNKCGSYQVKVI